MARAGRTQRTSDGGPVAPSRPRSGRRCIWPGARVLAHGERATRTFIVRSMSGAQWAGRKLHFIGIGGAGMSGLALVADELGAQVTGSDRADSPYCAPL